MQVLVYEHITATSEDDGSSMYREGRAMRDALVADLRLIEGVEVVEGERPDVSGTCQDIAIVIAPETQGILETMVAAFRQTHTVIASSPEALARTRDKLALAQHWHEHRVRTPATMLGADWPSSRIPAVLKPRDGAGSCDTFLCANAAAFQANYLASTAEMIAQAFVPGQPASVAFLVGTNETLALPPTLQHLSSDGRFQYLGGELPIPPDLAERATKLASSAIACVPGLLGYIGVDLVLGTATDGSQDFAIEINPRLTTSYVGLRAAVDFNIAEKMIDLVSRDAESAERSAVPLIATVAAKRVRFFADGSCQPIPEISRVE